MPTYEYRCPEGHDFEDFVLKISDAKPELPCPTCGKVAAKRMSAGSGLLFKGSGFYITDYGKDGKKDQRAGTKAADSSGGKAGAGAAATTGAAASGSAAPTPASKPSNAGTGSAGGSGSSAPKSGPAT